MPETVNDLQIRGYMLTTHFQFLRSKVGEAKAKAAVAHIGEHELFWLAKPAGWYPVHVFNEVSRVTLSVVANKDPLRAQDTFIALGRFMATEATNTFLRLFMRVLNPALMAKR